MRKRWTLMHGIARTRCAWNDYVREITLAEGIPDSYRPVIMFLQRNPGSSQKSISDFVGVTTSAINQVVKSMLEEGYLLQGKRSFRQAQPPIVSDRKGDRYGRRLRQRLDEADDAITEFVGAEHEQELMNFLHGLTDFIRGELKQC